MVSRGTIAAIASPPGAGERGVIRVSGPDSYAVLRALWVGDALPPRDARSVREGRIDDGGGTQPALLLWMPGPRSFTREDVVELHLPGSPYLLEAALARVLASGARAAEPGEFTRRAFENGRIDLTRAEGILELVHARSEAQRRSASALLFGGLSSRLAPLREELEALRSLAEASLDFDEADTGHVPHEELERRTGALLTGLAEAASWEARRMAQSDLPRVVLVGAPNAGKSSLFNRLVDEAEALVSDLRGTTRDVLHGAWRVGEHALRLYDTAGLDEVAEGPDADAQRLGEELREGADLLLWLVDPANVDAATLGAERKALEGGAPVLLAWTKADRAAAPPAGAPAAELDVQVAVQISAASGEGLDDLGAAAVRLLGLETGGGGRLERELGVRHRVALEEAARALEAGVAAWRAGLPLDLYAEALRAVGAELDSISGRTTPEDLLTRIFGAFCIGK